MAASTDKTNKPLIPRGVDDRPVDKYNRAELYSGKALDFDGVNDYVDGGTLDITGYTQMSMSFYFKAHSTTNDWRLISIRYSGSDDIRIFHATSIGGGKLSFALDDGTAVTFSEDFTTNEWYHVVMTHDGTTLKAYFNGILVQSAASGFNYSGTNGLFYIGRYTGGVFSYYDGEFSNFKLFNTALTATQVADLYNNPEKIVPTGVSDSALKLWLPMQEGAGTTAYDGSGNGNHGIIDGATYTHGIGAPVSQTAVIDWNKLYDFDGVDDQAYNASYNDTTGTKTYKVHFNSRDVTQQDQQVIQSYVGSIAQNGFGATIAPFGGNPSIFGLRVIFGGISGAQLSWPVENNTFYELVFTIDWDAQSVSDVTLNGETATGGLGARIANPSGGLYLGSRVNTMYLNGIINYFEVVGEEKWTNASGFKSESGSYDMTITGGPTQILSPQGLTSGRDITGVNLFENVRKQGALNLDGNSWAEVHDNASLDFGTGSFTLEAWVKVDAVDAGSSFNAILSIDGDVNNGTGLAIITSLIARIEYNGDNTGVSTLTRNNWAHLVGTFDGTNVTFYVNGVQDDQDARTAADITNANVKYIGRDTTSVRQYHNQIAQPRIYNRALTASEVLNNYNTTKNQFE